MADGSVDLEAGFTVRQWYADLPAEFIVRQEASQDLPAGFDPQVSLNLFSEIIVRQSDYVADRTVIYEDDETFWIALLKGGGSYAATVAEETSRVVRGTSSLRITIGAGTQAYVGATHDYGGGDKQDWSDQAFICLYWYGTNSGEEWILRLGTNGWTTDFYDYKFTDNFTGWRRIVHDLSAPDGSGGSPDLAAVQVISLFVIASGTQSNYLDRTELEIPMLHAEFIVRHEASQDLPAGFDGQVSLNLPAEFSVQHEASQDLDAEFIVRHEDEANLDAELIVRHSWQEDLPAEFIVRHEDEANLDAELIVRQSEQEDLDAELIVRHSGQEDLDAELIVRHEDEANLDAELIVRHSWQEDLPAEFIVRHEATLDLPAGFDAQVSLNLSAEFIVRHEASQDRLGGLTVRQSDYVADRTVIYEDDETFWSALNQGGGSYQATVAEETSRTARGTSSLRITIGAGTQAYVGATHDYGGGDKQDWSDQAFICLYWYGTNSGEEWILRLGTNGWTTDFYDYKFTDNFTGWRRIVHDLNAPDTTSGSPDLAAVQVISLLVIASGTQSNYLDRTELEIPMLHAEFIVRHEATQDLPGELIVRHSATLDLLGKFIVLHTSTGTQGNLYSKLIVRLSYPYWTNRRLINGVVDEPESLIGDADLELVIEGVQEDIQVRLDAESVSYVSWTTFNETPLTIKRAATYGAVAALYARRTRTFQGRVIPTVAPVTVTVLSQDEKAMIYWEDRMKRMLELYLSAQGATKLWVSTADEEPVFSMDDITPAADADIPEWHEYMEQEDP